MNYKEVYYNEHQSVLNKIQQYCLNHLSESVEIDWRSIYAELESFKKFMVFELDLDKELRKL